MKKLFLLLLFCVSCATVPVSHKFFIHVNSVDNIVRMVELSLWQHEIFTKEQLEKATEHTCPIFIVKGQTFQCSDKDYSSCYGIFTSDEYNQVYIKIGDSFNPKFVLAHELLHFYLWSITGNADSGHMNTKIFQVRCWSDDKCRQNSVEYEVVGWLK